jgi:hypothetical protein
MNAGDINIVSRITYIIKTSTEALLVTSNEVGLEVNDEKTKYVCDHVLITECRIK